MRIVEVRDLDGPNLFLMAPAIKVEIGDIPADQLDEIISRLQVTIRDLFAATDIPVPQLTSMHMETHGHIVVAFEWEHRAFARSLGCWAAQLVIGERSDHEQVIHELQEVLAQPPEEDDAPLLVRASEDRIPIVAVTGTNGKTTTSRLIAFVLHHAGHRVGLTSSAGVFIDKQQVVEGDYSGPSGARRVLAEPDVEFAVLETARGGLLLRGSGYELADVAVITNVSEDHLGIHGVHTIDGLAAVKAIVARNLREGGYCVLNADNAYTLAMKDVTPGVPVLFSADAESEPLQIHIANDGVAIYVDADKNVVWRHDGQTDLIAPLAEIPMTFGGLASHQVENALAAVGSLIGLGLSVDKIRSGLAAFRSSAENSKGRLNVYGINDATVIIDFAHNEAGLVHLLNFGRNFVGEDGNLIAVVGTAGDRDNTALRAIAHRASEFADVVVLKDSLHYLRGREPGEMLVEMREGLREANRPGLTVLEAPDERSATLMMLDKLQPNDVLAVMCVEDYDYLLKELGARGIERV